jgi:hypothetical protein
MMWSIAPSSSAKNRSSRAKSVASNAEVRSAAISSAAWLSRSGLRSVKISCAPSVRASLAVSKPIPELPPMTTTV